MKQLARKKIIPIALVFLIASPCFGQQAAHKVLPIETYLGKFASVPDNEKTRYLIELLVAVPDTLHPNRLFSWPKGKLGHVFLGLSKENGAQQVLEYIGFYARSPFLAFGTGLPVPSGIRNNEGHVYNVGIGMPLRAGQFDTVLLALQMGGMKRYSILSYNCVNFALDGFNAVRRHPLRPLAVKIGKQAFVTPGGLYAVVYLMRSGPEGQEVIVRNTAASLETDPLRQRLLRDADSLGTGLSRADSLRKGRLAQTLPQALPRTR